MCLAGSLLISCAAAAPAQDPVVIAIGDLHGDLHAAQQAFRLAGATNSENIWQGKNMVVIQTGDLIDRGPQDAEVLDWIHRLQQQAPQFNSTLHLLNSNHELMNVRGDFRYIHPNNFKNQTPEQRLKSFRPGGKYAIQLTQRPVIFQYGDTVFVHGGVLPHHVEYGVDKINDDYAAFLRGGTPLPDILNRNDSPLWTRLYSQGKADCKTLGRTLKKMGARRMVVAHTVQKQINSDCEGKVWRIDTGMSSAYGGTVQVLKITGTQVEVLR